MARDCHASVLHQQAPGNVTLLDGVRELMAPRPTVICELLEVLREPTMATRQLPDTTGAPQVVPGYPSAPGYDWGTPGGARYRHASQGCLTENGSNQCEH